MLRGWVGVGAMVVVCGVSALLIGNGCNSGPCSGLGMMRDDRPLPEPWDVLADPPGEAVGCMSQVERMQLEWSRNYELGDSPKAGYTAFCEQLQGKGWSRTDKTSTEPFEAWFERSGHSLRLFTSSHVEDMGWVTVEFKPAELVVPAVD